MRKSFFAILLFLALAMLLCACTPAAGGNEGDKTKMDPVITPRAEAIDVATSTLFSMESHIEDDGYTLPYQIYIPEDYDADTTHYPLVLFLHGAGERGDDNELQLKNAVQNLFDDTESPIYQSIFVAPQCPAGEQWVNTLFGAGSYSCDEVAESQALSAVFALLESLMEEYSVNPNRIYVMGLSMGGYGTWDLLMRHADTFAAAIPICGAADPAYAEVLADKPIYTFHGTEDGSVPIDGTREIVAAIRDFGGQQLEYVELEGYKHNVWDYATKLDGIMDWLFSHRLGDE